MYKNFTLDELAFIDDVLAKRTRKDEDSDCLYLIGGSKASVFRPAFYIPPSKTSDGKNKYIPLRSFLLSRKLGTDDVNPYAIRNTCGNPFCINADHLERGVGVGMPASFAVASVIMKWKAIAMAGGTRKQLLAEAGLSYITLSKYLKVYNEHPDEWDKFIKDIKKYEDYESSFGY